MPGRECTALLDTAAAAAMSLKVNLFMISEALKIIVVLRRDEPLGFYPTWDEPSIANIAMVRSS